MTNALRHKVVVKPGGLIEIRAPELAPGTLAEVIVLVESPEAQQARESVIRELAALPQGDSGPSRRSAAH